MAPHWQETAMAISCFCPTCQAPFCLPDEWAGRQARCQRCKGLFIVPKPTPRQPAESEAIEIKQAIQAQRGVKAAVSGSELDIAQESVAAGNPPPFPIRGSRRAAPVPESRVAPGLLFFLCLGLFLVFGLSIVLYFVLS